MKTDHILAAFHERYDADKIKKANDDELFNLILEMERIKEEHKLTLAYLQDRKEKSDKLLMPFDTDDEYKLKRENEILSHLDFMVNLAEFERKKFFPKNARESVRYMVNAIKEKMGETPIEEKQPIVWKGTKKEFCQFVKSEYQSHQNQYLNLKAASDTLYSRHKFPFKWTAKNCYELVKKTP